MSGTTLGMLARTTGGTLVGTDAVFEGVSTDSRTLLRGALFVALSGPNFDGHDFVDAARERGAAGALVERATRAGFPQVVVDDTRAALGSFAKAWRMHYDIPVVGLTGSNGKTTTKEMTAAILRQRGTVLATRGNLNNDIGVPLTLLGLSDDSTAAVVEMGANHPGEIGYLAGLTMPTVAVVTNAGPAHLEGFGSVEGVARAKGEIFGALATDGCAVINANDPYAPLWRQFAAGRRIVEFGVDIDADFRVASASLQSQQDGTQAFILECAAGEHPVRLPMPGRHNIHNALAATAAASAAGASVAEIVRGLAQARAVGGRLRTRRAAAGYTVVDDTYNANPASLQAALESQRGARLWLVLGDMGELGADAVALHREAGALARAAGIERLFALGPLAGEAAAAFGAGAEHFLDWKELSGRVSASLSSGVTVLVKGSRSMRMERVVDALVPVGEGN